MFCILQKEFEASSRLSETALGVFLRHVFQSQDFRKSLSVGCPPKLEIPMVQFQGKKKIPFRVYDSVTSIFLMLCLQNLNFDPYLLNFLIFFILKRGANKLPPFFWIRAIPVFLLFTRALCTVHKNQDTTLIKSSKIFVQRCMMFYGCLLIITFS